jgi:GAF domain-containing protein
MRRWVRIKEHEQGKWSYFTRRIEQLLITTIAVDGAAKGNVQIFNPLVNGLQIVTQRGFDVQFLQQFEIVQADEPSACGRAFRLRRRVIISDITVDRSYQPYLSIAESSGYRAVQSTPILSSDHSVIGILSTHFPDTHVWSKEAERALDEYASKIGDAITQLIESAVV